MLFHYFDHYFRVPTNLESQGESGKVREFGWSGRSQGILNGVREKEEKKKKREINKRTTRSWIINVISLFWSLLQGSHQPGKSGRVRESQGIWVVRESQGKVGILNGVREKEEKKKKREINKRTRNKKRTRNTIYNIDIYYIIRSEFL